MIQLSYIFSLDLFEGDIVLDKTVRIVTDPKYGSRTSRDTVANHINLWSEGVVPYVIDPNVGKSSG